MYTNKVNKSMEESLLPNEVEEETESEKQSIITWNAFSQELKRIFYIARHMVPVILSQYLIQVVSAMMVGHLGELYLSSTSLAISLTGVTGFSFLVSY